MNTIKILFFWFYNLLLVGYYLIKTLLNIAGNLYIPSDNKSKKQQDIERNLHQQNLFNKSYGKYKDDIIKGITAFKYVSTFGGLIDSDDKEQSPHERESQNEEYRQSDPLKAKGDSYEKYIGKQFENNGDLVIYNGFINGYGDQGVDIIVISSEKKTVNLVQCKNWEKKSFTVEDVEQIHSKLTHFHPIYHTIKPDDINYYLDEPKSIRSIVELLQYVRQYTVRKTLYISSEKVVDLAIGQHLKMMANNIFRYKDMKMVVKSM